VAVSVKLKASDYVGLPNNSAGGCPISIKFSTHYDHVPPDLPQTFKVNGSKVKVIA